MIVRGVCTISHSSATINVSVIVSHFIHGRLLSFVVAHFQIGVWPGVLQLIPMAVAMGLGFATCVGPALAVFDQHAGLHMFMLGTVTTHLTVS